MTDITSFDSILISLKDTHKVKRRKGLEKIEKLYLNNDGKISEEGSEFWKLNGSTFISLLSDESELNRQKVSEIILQFVKNDQLSKEQYSILIPVLSSRITNIPILEESEEVRASLIQILTDLTEISSKICIAHMNDIINILKLCVVDPSPDVRLLSCECVSKYAVATKKKFHMQSSSLIKPLINALVHQRFKNRIGVIKALGDILIYGDDCGIDEIYSPLAQKMLDIAQVRLVVVKVAGNLALNMKNRYSYWHKILPALISGLHDDDVDVKNTSVELWNSVGKKYEQENIDALKEDLDFDKPPLHFPNHERRYGVGCRTLVVKSLVYMIPAIINDITDWQTLPRIQASRLLITLILNAEGNITQYAEQIIESLIIATADTEQEVVKNALLSGEYLGAFLSVKVYLPLIISRLEGNDYTHHTLAVFAALLKGAESGSIEDVLPQILEVLTLPGVSHSRAEQQQTGLSDVLTCIINKCKTTNFEQKIFHILLLLLGSSASTSIEENTEKALQILAENNGKTVDGLYAEHLDPILSELKTLAPGWQEHSSEFLMFLSILSRGRSSLGIHLDKIVEILTLCVPRKNEPMVTIRIFTILQLLLVKHSREINQDQKLSQLLPTIVTECLLPYLPWYPGKTAESLRMGAVACFLAICDADIQISKEFEESMTPALHLLPAVIDDDNVETRMLSLKLAAASHKKFHQLYDSDLFYKMAFKISQRFDDITSKVRKEAAATLKELFSHLPQDHKSGLQSARLKELMQSMVIYLDDPDVESRQAFYGALENVGKVEPEILLDILQKENEKFRNKELGLKLIEKLKNLNI